MFEEPAQGFSRRDKAYLTVVGVVIRQRGIQLSRVLSRVVKA